MYRISYDPHYLSGETYETQDEAVAALGGAMGWADPVVSDDFPGGDGHTCAVCVYETQEECDDDDDGAYAPRVIEEA